MFAILGVYFLKPPFPGPELLTAPEITRFFGWLPSFWFSGLFQQLNGPTNPVFGSLAARALWSLTLVCPFGAVTLALAYRRNLRRIVEQPGIAPAGRSRLAARVVAWTARNLFSRPLDRAIFLFTARTIARSSQHRLLLAAYAGIGLALALAYVKTLIYVTFVLSGRSSESFAVPGTSLLAASLFVLFFAVIGARAVFALPITLPASWIFRITGESR